MAGSGRGGPRGLLGLAMVSAADAAVPKGADSKALAEEFGRLLGRALAQGNATIGSWEPANPEDQGASQQMNFHFVPNRQD